MAFDFYFAGTQCNEAHELICKLNANVLKSYFNDKKDILKWFERKRNGWKGKLLIDNGAFTFYRQGGSLDIDEYIRWLNDNDEYIDYAIALDDIPGKWGQPRTTDMVIKSAEKTYDNYLYMISKVKSPQKLLPVFHMEESFDYLRKYINREDLKYICIAGSNNIANQNWSLNDWYEQCMNIIRDSGRTDLKVHCLGSAVPDNVRNYGFTSMDATNWILCGASGNIMTERGIIYVGNKRKLTPIEYAELTKLLSRYDLTVEEVQTDYKARMMANVHYLYNMSKETSFMNNTSRNRRLF